MLRSDKPEARAFRKWITSEVLPAIRKTGGYIPTSADDDEKVILAKAVGIYERTVQALKNRVAYQGEQVRQLEAEKETLTAEKEQAERKAEANAPLAKYAKDVLQAKNSVTLTMAAKRLGLRSVYVLNKWLQDRKVIYWDRNSHFGWLPYAQYSGIGVFTFRTTSFIVDGEIRSRSYLTVTEEGVKWLAEKLAKDRKEGRV